MSASDIRKSPEETLKILRDAHHLCRDFDMALRNAFAADDRVYRLLVDTAIGMDPRHLTAMIRTYFDNTSRCIGDDLSKPAPALPLPRVDLSKPALGIPKATRHKGNNPSLLSAKDLLNKSEILSRNILRRFIILLDDGRDFLDMTRSEVEAWILISEQNAALGRTALRYAANIPYNKKMRDVLPIDFQKQLTDAWEQRHKKTFDKYREQLDNIHNKTETV